MSPTTSFVPPVGSYAVAFSSQRNPGDEGYAAMADAMAALAEQQPGYLGMRSARGDDGFGITVSYWDSLQAIAAWRALAEHRFARDAGRARWYQHYELQVCRVERAYAWTPADGPADPVLAR